MSNAEIQAKGDATGKTRRLGGENLRLGRDMLLNLEFLKSQPQTEKVILSVLSRAACLGSVFLMSWFGSWFSRPAPSSANNPPTEEKRLLEIQPAEPKLSEPIVPQERAQLSQVDRPNRNKVIFAAGTAFFAFSLLITRRSFLRKRLAANPAFYTNAPGHQAQQAAKVSGGMEAFEALNIATVNVLSLSMMATGGALWYLDINSMADARRMLRGGLGVDGTGRDEKHAEEDFEEWMATVLSRKEAKDTKAQMEQLRNERGKER